MPMYQFGRGYDMVTHTIDFIGNNNALKNVTINGKVQSLQSVARNTYRATFQTESDTAEVVLYETHQYTGKLWFLKWLFFYIISVFGIFDIKQNRRCLVTHLRFTIDNKVDSYTIVTFNDIKNSDRVASLQTSCPLTEIANEQYYDKKAQTIHKRINLLKFFITVALIIGLAVLLVNAL